MNHNSRFILPFQSAIHLVNNNDSIHSASFTDRFTHLSVHLSINLCTPPSSLTLTCWTNCLLHLLRSILRTCGRTRMTPYWVSRKLLSRGTLFTAVWEPRGGETTLTSLRLVKFYTSLKNQTSVFESGFQSLQEATGFSSSE